MAPRRGPRGSCGRGGSPRRPAVGSAKPTSAVSPATPRPAPRPRAGWRREVGLQVEVLGGVAGHAQLREDRQLGALARARRSTRRSSPCCRRCRPRWGRSGRGRCARAHCDVIAEVSPATAADGPSPPLRSSRCGPRSPSGRFSVVALAFVARRRPLPVSPGLADAVPSLASPSQKPFIPPRPRPTETRGRPTDDPDPNRNSYSVPEAPKSPACNVHFCVHWVAEGPTRPSLTDANGDGVPDYVEHVQGSPNTSTRSRTASSAGASRSPTGARGEATARPTSTWPRSAARCSATRPRTRTRRPRATGCRGGCTATSSSTTTTTPSSSRGRRRSTTSRSPSPTSTTTSSSSATTPTRTPGSRSRRRPGWRTRSTTASTTTCATCTAGTTSTTCR